MESLRRLSAFLVGFLMMIGIGVFGLMVALLLTAGTLPPAGIVATSLFAYGAGIASALLCRRVCDRSWRRNLLAVPLALAASFALLMASSFVHEQTCRTYHPGWVCPPWLK